MSMFALSVHQSFMGFQFHFTQLWALKNFSHTSHKKPIIQIPNACYQKYNYYIFKNLELLNRLFACY